jgi:hypothetical protein
MTREERERSAAAFDCDLFRLMERAHKFKQNDKSNSWHNVYWKLADARPFVRRLMSKKDREQTS